MGFGGQSLDHDNRSGFECPGSERTVRPRRIFRRPSGHGCQLNIGDARGRTPLTQLRRIGLFVVTDGFLHLIHAWRIARGCRPYCPGTHTEIENLRLYCSFFGFVPRAPPNPKGSSAYCVWLFESWLLVWANGAEYRGMAETCRTVVTTVAPAHIQVCQDLLARTPVRNTSDGGQQSKI